MSYAVRIDGQGWRSIGSVDDLLPGEVASELMPTMAAGKSKSQRKTEILDSLEDKPTRLQLKTIIQLSELTATMQAPAYGLTVTQAIAYAYQKNPTYRRAKDAETACAAIDAEAE